MAKTRGTSLPERSIRDKVYRHLQQKIASGEIEAGSAISELSLARQLGVSRTPVREALAQLDAEGIVQQSPNRPATVAKLSRQDIIELYELREALEVFAAGKASRQPVRSSDLLRLKTLTNAIEDLRTSLERSRKPGLDAVQMQKFVAYDLGFHTLLVRMAANRRILKIVNDTRLLIRIFSIRRQGHSADLLGQIRRQHGDVLRAVSEGDPERATRLLSDHIQRSLHERLDEFDQRELEASLRQSLPFYTGTP